MKTVHAVLLSVALAGCGHRLAAEATANDSAPSLTPAQLSFLKFEAVDEVEAGDLANVSGTVDFDDERTARLTAPVAGRVAELLVRVGDRVEADQPLLALESAEVRAAEAEYVRAEADERVARRGAERAERLREARAVSEKDWLQSREDARKAAADLDRTRAQLERLRLAPGERTSRYLLRAPFAGTVVERKALVGMEASPEAAEPLVVVSDLARVRVVVRLPERQLPLLAAGQAVEVRVDASPETFPGEVVTVGDVMDEATRTIPVRCTVPNPERVLKPSMFARVTLKAPAGRYLLTVPATALLSDGDHFRVIVRNPDGTLASRRVEIGAESNNRVQIPSGLAKGEEIVTEGALFAAQELGES